MCLGALGTITHRWDEGGIPMASVRFAERVDAVCLFYLPDAAVGDHLLVHMGFGLEMLDPEDASEAARLREEISTDGDDQLIAVPQRPRTGPVAGEPAGPE